MSEYNPARLRMSWMHDEDGVTRGTIFLIPQFQWCMAFDIDKADEGRYVVQATILGSGISYADSGVAHLDKKNHEFESLQAAKVFCETVVREVRDTLNRAVERWSA